MKLMNKKKGLSGVIQVLLIALVALVMLAAFGAMFWFMLIRPIQSAEHYLQVYQNPVTVTATVTAIICIIKCRSEMEHHHQRSKLSESRNWLLSVGGLPGGQDKTQLFIGVEPKSRNKDCVRLNLHVSK